MLLFSPHSIFNSHSCFNNDLYSYISFILYFMLYIFYNFNVFFLIVVFANPEFNSRSCIAFSCQVFPVSFNSNQQLSISLSFITVPCSRVQASCLVECPSIWVCLVFPHDWIQVRIFGRNTI